MRYEIKIKRLSLGKIIFDFEICFMEAAATRHDCEIHLLKFSSLYGVDVLFEFGYIIWITAIPTIYECPANTEASLLIHAA